MFFFFKVDDFEGIRTSLFSQNRIIHIGFGNSNVFSHKNRIHNPKSFWSENSQKEDYVKMMYEHDASQAKKIPPFIIRSPHVKKN